MKIGQVVKVINQDTNGKDFLEGYATVKGFDPQPLDGRYYCGVQFEGDSECFYRWVKDESISTMRSDRRVNPKQVEYRLLTFEECKKLTGHCYILDQNRRIAKVLITSVRTWKTRPDEIEIRCKYGLYEYFTVKIIKDICDNDELIELVTEESVS